MATVRIPTQLRKLTDGQEEVRASGATVGGVLSALENQHPGIRARISDEEGKIKRFVNVFVGDEDIRFLQNLETPVKDSDVVSIILAVAGG